VERKSGRIRRVKHSGATLAILALSASIALVDDFKTFNGNEYINATVSRVEPDGILIKYKSGISKIFSLSCLKTFRNDFITIPRTPLSSMLQFKPGTRTILDKLDREFSFAACNRYFRLKLSNDD